MVTVTELRTLAKIKGVKVEQHPDGHYRLLGETINISYWPNSRNRSAYIEGTKQTHTQVSPERAVKLACTLPGIVDKYSRDKRKYNRNKKDKKKMLKKRPFCHWCNDPLDAVSATVDHRIPLMRGGLDNMNNKVLSCQPCNIERGSDMTGDTFNDND